MQKANALVAIAGDIGNTVPKSGLTPAEVALLSAIHGENAVQNIEILDKETDIAARQLLQDLAVKYGRAMGRDNLPIIRSLFPTATSPVPGTFAELGLAEEQFTQASLDKMGGGESPETDAADKPLAKMTKAELVGYADDNELDVDMNANKPELLEAITAALAEAENTNAMG